MQTPHTTNARHAGPERRICVVTGSRAEYGILKPVMHEIRARRGLTLQVCVTGSHLSDAFGATWREIERDGFTIDAKVPMDLARDDAPGVTHASATCLDGFGACFAALRPDLVLVLGDRYEILSVANAATIARVPIAHIAGGDVTEGAFDDAFRHAITKLSHLHFVTNADAARRVRQMGEDPSRIHNVGSPSIDVIRTMRMLSREELAASLGMAFLKRTLLVTFHPVTLGVRSSADDARELLRALDALGSEIGIVMTAANADPEGQRLNELAQAWAAGKPNVWFRSSLGHERYLSLMHHCDAVVGNSSSGIYEAPALHKPTVNIGERQAGRLRASSVIDVPAHADAIAAAVTSAFAMDCSRVVCPYGDGHASPRIVDAIAAIDDLAALLRKRFIELDASSLAS